MATRNRPLLVLLVVLIVLFWVLGTVANALTPTLLKEHPLLLVALEPRNRNLLLTASRVDAVPFVIFGVIRRIASDPVYFALGHLYGEGAVRWIERRSGSGEQVVRATERLFARFSKLMVFLFPGLLVCVLAGATGMRTRLFLALNLAGTVAAVVVLRLFAHQLEAPLEGVLEWNDRNFRWLTVATIALVVVWVVIERTRGRSEATSVAALERELE